MCWGPSGPWEVAAQDVGVEPTGLLLGCGESPGGTRHRTFEGPEGGHVGALEALCSPVSGTPRASDTAVSGRRRYELG